MRNHVVVLAAVLGACGDATIGSNDRDAPIGIVVDARAFPDVFVPCSLSSAPDCPDGTRCLNGTCQTDECIATGTDGGSVCAEGNGCSLACVPLSDPCNGVTCEAQQTCFNGKCVAGCFSPSRCLNKTCDPGQFCSNGSCVDITPCTGTCPEGTVCNIFCRPLGPCEGVQCQESEVCAVVGGVGTCVTNLCFNKTCAATFICSNGDCVPTCDCNPPCEAFESCVNNQCVCKPDCANKPCGASDGCTGTCGAPNCPVGAKCGDPDGCNGLCNGACVDDDKTCHDGVCTCPAGKTCGADCCGSDEVCNSQNSTCCNFAAACAGQPCGTVVCGGAYTCPGGSCADPNQSCQGGVCKCRTACPAGSNTCCGAGDVCNPETNACCTPTVCDNTDPLCGILEKSCGRPCTGCPQNPDQTCAANGHCECRIKCGTPLGSTCCLDNQTCNTTTNTCQCVGDSCNGSCCPANRPVCTQDTEGCCATAQACPDKKVCCNGGESCFQNQSGQDACCVASRWCSDSKQCCPSDKPNCLNDDDQMADNDVCCANNQFLCNGACCPNSNDCVAGQCVVTCNPPCGCLEYCNNGTCQPIQCDLQDVCGCNCCNQVGQVCRPDLGFVCGPIP